MLTKLRLSRLKMQKNNSGVNVKNNGHGHKKFIFDLD